MIHKYSTTTGTYMQSRQGLCTFSVANIIYIGCLYKHLTEPQIIEIFEVFSKIVYHSIYVHLFVGIFNSFVIIINIRSYLNLSREITEFLHFFYVKHMPAGSLTIEKCRKFSLTELFVYYKMFSNTIFCICVIAYDLTIIDLHNITLSKIMLLLALVYPHFNIANVLRYFTINTSIIAFITGECNKELANICLIKDIKLHSQYTQFIQVINVSEDNNDDDDVADGNPRQHDHQPNQNEIISNNTKPSKFSNMWQQICSNNNHKSKSKSKNILMVLESIKSIDELDRKINELYDIFEKIKIFHRKLNNIIQFQLFLLAIQHTLIVVVLVHMLVETYLEWDIFFNDNELRMIKINYISYLLMICNDCICLAGTERLFSSQVNTFLFI